MKKIFTPVILVVIALLSFACSFAQQSANPVALKVVIIRHGEKPETGDNLSCAGLNRALALPPVLKNAVGIPDYTYVPTMKTGKKTGSVRMFQTVTPFAVKYNLTINSKYQEMDSTGAASDVLKKRGVVLMVWEHSNIPPLARALGVPGELSWKGKDFDSIWTIEFTENADKTLTFKDFKISQENITPSDKCK
jgi:hypothetical protein